jgi:CRP-like cAMP-binding protein
LLYNVPTTATVVSRNYNTMATLGKQHFLDLLNEIPDYKTHLRRHIYAYQDPNKENIKNIVTRIPYFGPKFLNKHLFHTIIYNFITKYYLKDMVILREQQDDCNKIIIVVSGILEVFTNFEGNEFIIESLEAGSILNFRNLFTDDLMQVNVRTVTNVQTLELSEDKLREIVRSDP